MSTKRANLILEAMGGLMFSLFLATALIHFTDWIKTHADAVTAFMYASGALAVICLLWRLSLRGSDRPFKHDQPPVTVTSSPTISPTIAPVFAPVFNNFPQVPLPVPEPESSSLRFDLLILSQRRVRIEGRQEPWTEWYGECMAVIPVKYMLSSDGAIRSGVANNICASLRFINNSAFRLLSVEKAFWLGQTSSEVAIPIGESRELIVGTKQDGSWVTFQNGNPGKPVAASIPFWDDNSGQFDHFDLEVTIFSSTNGEAFATHTYRYKAQNGGYLIQE